MFRILLLLATACIVVFLGIKLYTGRNTTTGEPAANAAAQGQQMQKELQKIEAANRAAIERTLKAAQPPAMPQ